MMDTIWRMAAVALAAAAIVALLKKTSPDMAFLLVLAVCCAAIGVFAKYAADIAGQFRQGISAVGLPEELFAPLVKTVAIAVITKTAGDICRDSGETSIGNLVETAGASCSPLRMPFCRIIILPPFVKRSARGWSGC